MQKSLRNLLVVSLEQAVAAPYCSSKLADAGARVIKLERKEGDFARGYDAMVGGESAYFIWLNRGKESICVDIKKTRDQDLIHNMLSKADIFIQNLAPGASERVGLGSQTLREAYPQLITCDISGYGPSNPADLSNASSPYRDMRAYDLLVQGETGLISVTGRPEAQGRVGISVADINCGLHAYTGILEALIDRQQTGQGSGVEVSLFGCLADWMNVPYLQSRYGGEAPQPIGIGHPTIAPYGLYHARNGRPLIISIQNEREWQRFVLRVLERPELLGDTRYQSNADRVEHRTSLNALIDDAFLKLDHTDLTGRLQQNRIAFGHLNSVEEFAQHPQLELMDVRVGEGIFEVIRGGIHHTPSQTSNQQLTDTPSNAPPAVPALGQNSASLRREFGSGAA